MYLKTVSAVLFIVLLCDVQVAAAAIVTDDTIGPAQTLAGPAYAVDADDGQEAGQNLYFSFETLELSDGESLTIDTPDGVTRVLVRVTGGEVSVLNGTVEIASGANLYVLNPAGVTFGSGAEITAGSTYVSAGHSLLMSGEEPFLAARADPETLSESAPNAFGVAGSAGEIALDGAELATPEDATLFLLGGSISLTGGAKVEVVGADAVLALVSSTGVGTVSLEEGGPVLTGDLGPITADSNARITAVGGDLFVSGGSLMFEDVRIESITRSGLGLSKAGLLELAGNVIGLTTSSIQNIAQSTESAGEIVIGATTWVILEDSTIRNVSPDAGGGGVQITTDSLEITGGSVTVLCENGVRSDGSLDVVVTSLYLEDTVLTAADGRGEPGGIDIQAETGTFRNDVFIVTSGANRERSGDIALSFSDSLRMEGTSPGAACHITTGNTDGSAGTLTLVSGILDIDGVDVSFQAAGATGSPEIFIETEALSITSGDVWSTRLGEVRGTAPMHITTDVLRLESGAGLVVEGADGTGGDLQVRARESVTLNQSTLGTRTEGTGDAGNVRIETVAMSLNGSTISSTAMEGDAGEIWLEATDRIDAKAASEVSTATEGGRGSVYFLAGNVIGFVDSAVVTSVGDSRTFGGNVWIDGGHITLDNGDVQTSAREGFGGDISLLGTDMVMLNDSVLSTCSENVDGSGDIEFRFSSSISFETTAVGQSPQVRTCNIGVGDAGPVGIQTPLMVTDDTLQFDVTAADGDAGDVTAADDDMTIVRITRLDAAGSGCAEGGVQVELGKDDGDPGGAAKDAILQPEEVDQTTVICEGQNVSDEVESLIAVSEEAPGDTCPAGGNRIDVGLDDGEGAGSLAGNGQLEAGEIDNTTYLCGDEHQSTDSLVETSEEPPGGNCAAGGQRIDMGLDDGGDPDGVAGDGILQEGEIDSTNFVCASLVDTTVLLAGDETCRNGGTRLNVGYDDGLPGGLAGDGVLQPEEIEVTYFICRPSTSSGDTGCRVGAASPRSPAWFLLVGGVLLLGRRRPARS